MLDALVGLGRTGGIAALDVPVGGFYAQRERRVAAGRRGRVALTWGVRSLFSDLCIA